MKKIILLLLFVLVLAATASAQIWVRSDDTITLLWDAVPKIQPSDVMKYQPYVKYNVATATPQPIQGEIEATTVDIQFTTDAKVFLCVEALRYPVGETTPIKSSRLACTDIGGDTASGNPFGVSYFVAPGVAGGLSVAP